VFRLRIAIIGTTASSIIGFRGDLIGALSERGCKVFALAVDYTPDDKDLVRSLGAEPVDFTLRRTALNPVLDIKDMLRLSRLIKSISPDIVFSYFAKPVIYGTLAAVLAKVPKRVGMLEGLGYAFTDQPVKLPFKTRFIRWVQVFLYKIAFLFLDRVVFLNKDDPLDLVVKYKIKVRKVDVLGGIGLNLERYPFTPPPKGAVSFIFVGRLLAEKGIREFLAAADIVKSRYPLTRFVVLGGIDKENPGAISEASLKELVRKDTIVYPGHVEDVTAWLAESSVFVLPSYREGFPRSTQEAMAIGRAVITTDAPGCRETVEDGVNGYLVPRWSSGALAKKMFQFIEKPELIDAMGQESYRMARTNFDAEVVNRKMLEILDLK